MANCCDVTQYRALCAGEDWAPALAAALRECDHVHMPAGEYALSEVVIPSGRTLYGDGAATRVRALGERLFTIRGEAREQSPLARDMADFSDTLETREALGVQPGDLVYLFGQRNCQILQDCGYDWALGRTYAKGFASFYAEFLEVAGVSADGRRVTACAPAVFPYYYADGRREHAPRQPKVQRDDYPQMRPCTTAQKIAPARQVTLRDMRVLGCRAGTVIRGQWLCDCLIERLDMRTDEAQPPVPGFMFVHLSECLRCVVRDCDFHITRRPPFREDYVWADYWAYNTARILSSDFSGFEGCTSDFSTHAFEIGKFDKRGACHACFVRNCTASNAVWSGVFVSGGSYDTTLSGNVFTQSGQGIVTCGRKNTIIGNRIDLNIDPATNYYYVRPLDGGTAGLALIEGYSVDSVVRDNVVSHAVTALLIRDGYEDDNQFETGEILLENNTVTDCARALMVYRNTSNQGSKAFRLIARGNRFAGGAPGSRFAGEQGILCDREMDKLIEENNVITGFATPRERLPLARRCDRANPAPAQSKGQAAP